MIDLSKYKDIDSDVKITCVDGQILVGQITSFDDEEDSGFGEIGISITMKNGAYVGIGVSEISSIDVL